MTITLKRTVNLSEPILPEVLSAPLYQDEKNAHTFVIEATKNKVPLPLEGSVTAYFVRGDGNTVQLEGDIVDAMAKVTLTKSCYYTGTFRMAVMLITQETRTVIYAASGRVKGIKDGEIIDGGENEENGTPGAVGKDGATFFPYVDENGNLSWTNDKDLPNPPTVNIEGPPGPAGQDGKTAYQYARDGGYTGSEAEFASKMAKEIPEPYTLPVASADTLGGVKVGDGLEVVDGKLKVKGAALLSEGKLRQYAALFNGSEDIESFLFFTDPHLINRTTLAEIRNNVMNDLQSIRDYYAGTPTSFVLCTGDWIDDDYDGDEACFLLGIVRGLWKRWFDDGCFAVGNHEYNDCGTQLLDVNTVHNLLLPHKENNYYAYDGNKTKFYVLDTGLLGYDHTEYGWEQIDWLAGKLIEDNAEHSAIASHIWYISGTDGTLVLTPFADAVLQLSQAYNGRTTITLNEKAYDFTAATGYVEFVIGGHKHVDKTAEEYGIPVIISTNVTINGHGNPTFDLVFADYTNRKIDFVRIGTYSNRTVQLADRGSGDVTYTNLVPTAVSPVADEVYNGVGYKNNTIRSGSADRNYEGEKDGYVLTGIIDCYIKMTNWKTLPTIYVKGNIETDETEYSSVALWMDGKVRKGTLSFIREMNPQSGFIVERLADGYYKMTPTVRDDGKLEILVGMGSGDVTGIQINLKGTGEGMIVTVDEPIE